jgi:hypothetical protein
MAKHAARLAATEPLSTVGNGHLIFLEKVLGAFIEDKIRVNSHLSVSLSERVRADSKGTAID